MHTNRISFLFIIFVVSSCLFNHASEQQNSLIDIDYFHAWKNYYVDRMSAEEKQMLANILHLFHAIAIAEEKAKQFPTPIAHLNQTIRVKIAQYENPTDDIAMLKTLLERLSFVINTRTIYLQTYSTCATFYNQNAIPLIEEALASIQLYAQTQLRNWADEKDQETRTLLKKSSDAIDSTVQYLHVASNLYKGMSNGELPMHLRPEDEENKPLMPLHIILQNNPQLYAATENVINALNATSDRAAQIIHVSTEIYKQFYTILYNDLTSSGNCRYATTLFSMHGLLPEEYVSLLPHPDHVFEHMLQTTKMYTEAEFLLS